MWYTDIHIGKTHMIKKLNNKQENIYIYTFVLTAVKEIQKGAIWQDQSLHYLQQVLDGIDVRVDNPRPESVDLGGS